MSMTTERREELEELYVDEVVEGMDIKTLVQFTRDSISAELSDCSDAEFIENVAVNHEHLLTPSELLGSGVYHVKD